MHYDQLWHVSVVGRVHLPESCPLPLVEDGEVCVVVPNCFGCPILLEEEGTEQ